MGHTFHACQQSAHKLKIGSFGAIRTKYKIEVPKELAEECLQCYILLHPEDAGKLLLPGSK